NRLDAVASRAACGSRPPEAGGVQGRREADPKPVDEHTNGVGPVATRQGGQRHVSTQERRGRPTGRTGSPCPRGAVARRREATPNASRHSVPPVVALDALATGSPATPAGNRTALRCMEKARHKPGSVRDLAERLRGGQKEAFARFCLDELASNTGGLNFGGRHGLPDLVERDGTVVLAATVSRGFLDRDGLGVDLHHVGPALAVLRREKAADRPAFLGRLL